jgi:hypothetical protein
VLLIFLCVVKNWLIIIIFIVQLGNLKSNRRQDIFLPARKLDSAVLLFRHFYNINVYRIVSVRFLEQICLKGAGGKRVKNHILYFNNK